MQTRNSKNAQGIDVSHWQGTIDWKKVAAAGISFSFIKATQNGVDNKFLENVKGAKAAGLLVGAYHFLDNSVTTAAAAKLAAQTFYKAIQTAGGVSAFELPPVLDYESKATGVTTAVATALAKAFLEELKQLTGVTPMLYTYPAFIGNFSGLSSYPLWIARYSTQAPADASGWTRWDFWQYSDGAAGGTLPSATRSVPGINGSVDLNEYAGTFAELKTRYGKKSEPVKETVPVVAKTNPFEAFKLTSPFGTRINPVSKQQEFHRGVDLVTSPSNGPLYAFVAGEVMHAKEGLAGSGFGGYGIVVAIKDDKGYLHCYAHLSAASVKVGDKVAKGQKVGLQGSTGISTGAHLHYEIRKATSPSFGYTATEAGVVEPTKYLQDYYAKGEVTKVNKTDANAIIDKYLKPAYGAAKTPAEQKEIGRLADELRVASGQPKQNV